MKDYYQVLRVRWDAGSEEISRAYRTLALRHHPDLPGGDGELMREVNEAYAVLSDPARRQVFDRDFLGRVTVRDSSFRPARWFNPRRPGHLKAMALNRREGLRQVPHLMETIAVDGDLGLCFAVKDLLVCFGRPVANHLQAYLSHTHERVRYFALLAISEIGHWPPPRRLVVLLADPWAPVRAEAALGLGACRAWEAIPSLGRALGDEAVTVRLAVVEALERLGGPEAARAVTLGLQDLEARVRAAAATALGRLGQPEAISALGRLTADENPFVRRAARRSLSRLRARQS